MGGYSKQCPVCGKWYVNPAAYHDHVKSHTKREDDLIKVMLNDANGVEKQE